MGLIERFTGQPEPDERFGYLIANPSIARPISYQMLFMGPLDLDEAETVTVLGWPRGTVKSRLHRALSRLREAMEAAGLDPQTLEGARA